MSEDAAEIELSPRIAWVILLVATIVAATPHFFFAPPLELHMVGATQSWLGISVWAPAILAGVAFFFGVEFGARFDDAAERFEPATRTGVVVILLLGYLVMAAAIDTEQWADMAGVVPWEELSKALPLYAGLRALEVLFFQGFAQHRVMAESKPAVRVLVVAALSAAVVAPFAMNAEAMSVLAGLVPLVFAESLIAAIAFESGFAVRSVMLARAVCGAAFIWFQQGYLL